MKSLQLLAGMSVLALAVSACSTTNTATWGMPDLSGQKNPDTGKYTPPPSPMPPARTSSAGYPSSASNGSYPSSASAAGQASAQSGYSSRQNMAKAQ